MLEFSVNRSSATRIEFGAGIARERCKELVEERACFFVVDQAVAQTLEGWDFLKNHQVLVLDVSEGLKSPETLQEILAWMQRLGFARRDLLVVVGGGVLSDTAGLAAALYLRGVSYFLVPTTLVAQVDASIGGKVGVNFGISKNSVGSFWHPEGVAIDVSFLETLPFREYQSGFAEIVKVAMCCPDAELFRYVERNASSLLSRQDSAQLMEVVGASVLAKWEMLEPDPFETDLDRSLNLGHTVAHALEHATNYERYLHGEAVSIGIATATRFGVRQGLLSEVDGRRIEELLNVLGLPTALPPEALWAVTTSLQGVLLARGGRARYVVPVGIGQVRVIEPSDFGGFLREAMRDEDAGIH